MPVSPDQFSLGSETAQALSGGAFAAGAREYLRPAIGWQKRCLSACLCVGAAVMFGDDLASWLGLSMQPASALAGLVCLGVAEGVLKAADKFDVGGFFKRGAG